MPNSSFGTDPIRKALPGPLLWVGFWCGVEILISDKRNRNLYRAMLTFATGYCLGGSLFFVIVKYAQHCHGDTS
ncbi:hypothetical protein AAVH_13228 [Aphelenchoides avenae]|nr:hypothetical protein AAVH_13228 [Aphelenchus avenae]